MKTAKLTIQVIENKADIVAYSQSHRGGLILDVGDVVVSMCMDGNECGSRVFQSVQIKENGTGNILASATGIDMAAEYVDTECFAILEAKK